MYIEVILPLALPTNYTWSVPPELQDKIVPGCRVEVGLGKNRKYAGLVKRIHFNKPGAFEPKDILNVLDGEAIVYPHQLELWKWMAEYYMCTEGDVMQAALPAHFKLSSETILLYNDEFGDDFSTLEDEEYLVAEALLIRKELRLPEVQQLLDSSHVYPVIKKLIDKRVCFVWEALKDSYREKKETYVILNPEYDNEEKLSDLLNNWGRAPRQMELLLAYLHLMKTQGEVTQTELLKKAGASLAQLKGLQEKNILMLEKRSVDRLTYLPKNIQIDFELSLVQQSALDEIYQSFETKQVCLLHGVTSSGKTLLYIKLIESYIRQGKQVLYMLPEIALTAQVIRRLQKHFGGYIAIYHSRFNQNERIEIWNKVKTGEIKVVLGARSSLFLPFKDLGLIICDEEHDPSFKQYEPAPRYHARDAAVFYAGLLNAKVLMGSATPSMESYYNAVNGKYGLVEINERYGESVMPDIEIVDTRKMFDKVEGKIILSPALKEAIQTSLDHGRQIILFQNRRGYSPYQVCATCGWIPKCQNCNVSLTFHKFSHKFQCHYCGTTYPPLSTCAACGSHHFVQRSFGTEKIEEALSEVFPEIKVARMDVDTVRGKHAHDSLIQQFEQQRINILVGTQMVVKGLDFENVDLVG
ncbi:MAG TPA: primosomal protein N', partial [Parasegetibacter sp.]